MKNANFSPGHHLVLPTTRNLRKLMSQQLQCYSEFSDIRPTLQHVEDISTFFPTKVVGIGIGIGMDCDVLIFIVWDNGRGKQFLLMSCHRGRGSKEVGHAATATSRPWGGGVMQ
mmetsp:Transcript_24315/g.51149  ORF Transcript_24315/g.51149 Transcript_24315/m.51149 type:complete len:114 (+) Transcript_24315:31-372(+)